MEEITPDRLNRIFKNLNDLSEATELRIFDEKIGKIANLNHVPRIKTLNLSYNQICDIEGLKHCPDLKEINLSHNKITSVSSFAFEKNKQVTTLDLSHNQIEKFAASSTFLKLQVLNLEYNMLSTIEFIGNCKELRILNLSNNRIKRIDPVDYLTKLEELYVRKNQISEISERNLKNNPNLSMLDISYNQLKSITFAQNIPSLVSFNCSHNTIKFVEFSKEMTCLENLDLSYNEFPLLTDLGKCFPNLVTLDFSSNFNLDTFEIDSLAELVELRELNFKDNFFVTKALEEELHQQYPYLEVINDKQYNRPGYIELYELEKMKEDPDLSSLASEPSENEIPVSAKDEYNLGEIKKGLESKATMGKKFDKILNNEEEFKAYMQNYQFEMYKLRALHQTIVKGKDYLIESDSLQEVEKDLDQSLKEELKSMELDRRKSESYFMTQGDKRLDTPSEKSETSLRGKPETPTKNLRIKSQRSYRPAGKIEGQIEKSDKKALTKTTQGFSSQGEKAEKKPLLGMADEFMQKLDKQKENFRVLKSKANTISLKEYQQSSKNRFKLANAIQMSKTFKEKAPDNSSQPE